MKIKSLTTLVFCTLILTFFTYSQEALKSIEEEYYDFLSLTGIVERPTLGYRTLSDSVWNFKKIESFEENDDGTFTKVRIPGQESQANIWKNNNLGTCLPLWQPENPSTNFFMRGLKQGLFLKLYGPEWYNSYNTAAPYGQNDGALWQGRGYNTALSAGLRLEGYGFELTFKPQVSFSQNLEFEYLTGVCGSEYSYFTQNGGSIDLVQRYGNTSFWNYDWGDSEIRWTWNTFTIGFGSQNPWLGPAQLNPMLGSNNAPSYTKFDAGLRKTKVVIPGINWNLGNIEGRIWNGKLKESDYFDNDPNNNERMLTAMSASYEPSFIPGLTIGANRIFITYWRPENFKYLLRLFTFSRSNALASSGNDEDQKFSLFVRWEFPSVGFKVYGEFGRDDFSSDEKANPLHTAIYTIGAKQTIHLPYILQSELSFEINNFEMSQDFQLQWPYIGYYAHGFVKQGYTSKGQILGAGSGYFGNSQFVQYKVYYPKGYTSFKFQRYCPNINYVYSKAVNNSANNSKAEWAKEWYANYETIFCFGIESYYCFFDSLGINFSFNFVNIYKRMNHSDRNDKNFNIILGIKYNI